MLSISRYAKSNESTGYVYFSGDWTAFYYFAMVDFADGTRVLVRDWSNGLFYGFFFISILP